MANCSDYELTVEVLRFVLTQWEENPGSIKKTLDCALRMAVVERTPVTDRDSVHEGFRGVDRLMCVLMDRGATSDAKDGAGQNCIFYAHAKCPHMLPALRDAEESLDANARPNVLCKKGRSEHFEPTRVACEGWWPSYQQ